MNGLSIKLPKKKKKKKKKKAAEDAGEVAPAAAPVKAQGAQASSAPKAAAKAAAKATEVTQTQRMAQDRADAAAEKDADYQAIKAKVEELESSITSRQGTPASWKKEADAIADEIEKFLVAKKVKKPKDGNQISSHKLAQSLEEMKASTEIDGENKEFILQDLQTRLEEARAYEVLLSLRTKVNAFKARLEAAIKQATPAAAPTPAGGKGAGPVNGRSGEDRDAEREASLIKRLAGGKETEGMQLHKKIFELELDVLKYLFQPPCSFRERFERDFPVLIFQGRPAKGAGKGLPPPSPKEVVVYSLSNAEAEKCTAALKALDFSGSATKEMDKACFDNGKNLKAIEQEFQVFISKQREKVTVCGKRENVQKAFSKGEETKTAEKPNNVINNLDPEKAKALNPKLGKIQDSTGAKVFVPAGGNKVVIQASTQKEVDAATKEVEDYLKTLITEIVPGDPTKVKASGGASPSSLNRRYKDICDKKPTVSINKRDDGFALTGPKDDVLALKAQLVDLMKIADFEPQKLEIPAEKVRVFNKDTTAKISEISGADVRRGGNNAAHLVIIGDEAQVEKAKEEIEKVLEQEGSSETIPVTEKVIKMLLANSGEKIREMENTTGANLSIKRDVKEVVILGSSSAVQGAVRDLKTFSEKVEKAEKAAEGTAFQEIQLTESGVIKRIIGPRGSVLRNITETCFVQVKVKDEELKVEVRGEEDGVAKAVEMINDIIARGSTPAAGPPVGESPSSPTASPKEKVAAESPPVAKSGPSRKKAQEFKRSEADFPTLGGGAQEGNARSSSPWGPRGQQDEGCEEKGEE